MALFFCILAGIFFVAAVIFSYKDSRYYKTEMPYTGNYFLAALCFTAAFLGLSIALPLAWSPTGEPFSPSEWPTAIGFFLIFSFAGGGVFANLVVRFFKFGP